MVSDKCLGRVLAFKIGSDSLVSLASWTLDEGSPRKSFGLFRTLDHLF